MRIPNARLLPLLNEYERRDGLPDANTGLAGRIRDIRRHPGGDVSFGVADKLLTDLDMEYEWHASLSDLYDAQEDGERFCACGCGRNVFGESIYKPGHNRKAQSFLSPKKIEAAAALYAAGMSLPELAEHLWRDNGYTSVGACTSALGALFRERGIKQRNWSEANLLRHAKRGCSACGCKTDDRTYGCSTCTARHSRRRRFGIPAPTVFPVTCRACGGHLDDLRPGCRTCASRHRQRARMGYQSRVKRAAALRSGLGGLSTGRTLVRQTAGGGTTLKEAS